MIIIINYTLTINSFVKGVNLLDFFQLSPELSLHYMDTQDYKIESQLGLQITTDQHARFGFVLKGSVKVSLAAGIHRQAGKVTYGEVFFLPPHCSCMIHNSDNQASHVILIQFGCEGSPTPDSSRWTTPFMAMNDLRLHHFRMPRIRSWIQTLTNNELHKKPAPFFLVQSYLYTIAAEFMAFIDRPGFANDNLHNYVVQMKQDILEHCSSVMDIEEMARLSGSSPARFYQLFKRHTGISPLQFMTIARLNESLYLLSNGSLSIKDIAHSVGYLDELYFSRLFKKHMGISPTHYAACSKIRVANLCPVFRGDLSVLGITPVIELEKEWFSDPDKEKYVKQIEQCRPELILTAPVEADLYQTLSQICPVVMIQWKGYSWKKRLLEISRIVQIPSVAERWLSYYQKKVENARDHIGRRLGDKPFLVVSVFESFYRVYGMQRMKMKDLFYDELQMTPPASAEHISFLDVATLNEVAALDCDHLVLLVPTSIPEDTRMMLEDDWLKFKKNQKNKQCFIIRHTEPLLYNASFYEGIIDGFVNQLIMN
jgi:AraC-like DNA-binding protein/ABC-type Fe3+-hydroxamate transport system substrate-binding protein